MKGKRLDESVTLALSRVLLDIKTEHSHGHVEIAHVEENHCPLAT